MTAHEETDMAADDWGPPVSMGLLLIENGKLHLCCCREASEAIRMVDMYPLRSQLFDLYYAGGPDLLGGTSSDICPFCGAKNILRYGTDGSHLDYTTWHDDLERFAEDLREKLDELERTGDDVSGTLRWLCDSARGKCGGDVLDMVSCSEDEILGGFRDLIG